MAERKRAGVACQACHDRKVRCNLAQSGPPCVNCSLDGLTCVERPNKRRKVLSAEDEGAPRQFRFVEEQPNATLRSKDAGIDYGIPSNNIVTPISNQDSPSEELVQDSAALTDSRRSSSPYQPFNAHFSHHEQSSTNTGPSNNNHDELNRTYAPIYGDPRTSALVVDIIEPERRGKTGHYFVPQASVENLAVEDIDYLRLKGVFNLPDASTCDSLVQLYFHHVHPFFPLVDVGSFFATYQDSKKGKLSLQLLWSMFLASSNYAGKHVLRKLNCASRKEMKRSMYAKAKALYDAGYERNKIILIQAVLLMAFWYADTDDRSGAWHWNGVAISLCQTIGLHRKLEPGALFDGRKTFSEDVQRQWRQIFWCCFHREAFFSIGLGRPMRINLEDCNLPLPVASDLDLTLAVLSDETRRKYFVEDISVLSELWSDIMKLTATLADIISMLRPERPKLKRAEVEGMEQRIKDLPYLEKHSGKKYSPITALHLQHLELYVDSTLLVLYRPHFFERPQTESRAAKEWRSIVEQKVRASTASFNRVLEILIGEEMVSQCHSMICIALIPVLQVHLLDSTSSKPLIQRIGRNRLDLCLIVVEELRSTYFGAEVMSRMFPKAQMAIMNRKTASTNPSSHQDTRTGTPETNQDTSTGLTPSQNEATEDDIFSMACQQLNPFSTMNLDTFSLEGPFLDLPWISFDDDSTEQL